MIRGLGRAALLGVAGCAVCGPGAALVGCSVIIGDIEIPSDEVAEPAVRALAGAWRVYGLTEAGALDMAIEVDAAGGLADRGTVVAGRITVADGVFTVPLGGAAGAVSGPIESGLGLLVGDGLTWAVMVREPAERRPLPAGWGAVVGLTAGGDPSGGVSRLVEGESEGYVETRYLADEVASRPLYVDTDPGDAARRALVPADGGGGDRYLTALDGWAIGVRVAAGRRDLALIFAAGGAADGAPLPAVEVRCVGVALDDDAPGGRVRTATLGPTVRWGDGSMGTPTPVDGGWALPLGSGFFDDVDTLLLGPSADGVYAALPIAPPTGRASAAVSWGVALCVERAGAGAGADAGIADAG